MQRRLKEQQRQRRITCIEVERVEEASIWEQELAWQALLQERHKKLQQQKQLEEEACQQELNYQMLLEVLRMIASESPVCQALFETKSNIRLLLKGFNIITLKHEGLVLSAKEQNRLIHALNKNIRDVTQYWKSQWYMPIRQDGCKTESITGYSKGLWIPISVQGIYGSKHEPLLERSRGGIA